jgi:hypothetical protein
LPGQGGSINTRLFETPFLKIHKNIPLDFNMRFRGIRFIKNKKTTCPLL